MFCVCDAWCLHSVLSSITCCVCVQLLVIASKKVKWAKQGTCCLVDNEPKPPTGLYASAKWWKEVNKISVVQKGGDCLFPMDQILLVTPQEGYKIIKPDNQRMLSKLSKSKNYLVWYHRLLQQNTWRHYGKS